MRTPTEKQFLQLLCLGSGNAGLSYKKGDAQPLINHGWATGEWDGKYYQWVRITAQGLSALSSAVESYGLPEIGPNAKTRRRVCADCGSRAYRFETVTADEVLA